MEFSITEIMLIGLFSFIISIIINKYMVNLQNEHCYYTLFNKLKFNQTEIEKNQKELDENLLYDRQKFKQTAKPIRLVVDNQEQQQNHDQQKEEEKNEILFMKVDSLHDIVIEDEDEETIDKLE